MRRKPNLQSIVETLERAQALIEDEEANCLIDEALVQVDSLIESAQKKPPKKPPGKVIIFRPTYGRYRDGQLI